MGCKHGNIDSGKRSISIENIFFASELQFRRLQKNELEKSSGCGKVRPQASPRHTAGFDPSPP